MFSFVNLNKITRRLTELWKKHFSHQRLKDYWWYQFNQKFWYILLHLDCLLRFFRVHWLTWQWICFLHGHALADKVGVDGGEETEPERRVQSATLAYRFTAMLLAVYIKIEVRSFLICLNQGQIISPLVWIFQAQYLMTWTPVLGLSLRKIKIANTRIQSPHGTPNKVRGFTGTLRSQMIKQTANG